MTKPWNPPMRDAIMLEVRQAVSDYFIPTRFVLRLIARGFRFVMGRPEPARHDTGGWWRSA